VEQDGAAARRGNGRTQGASLYLLYSYFTSTKVQMLTPEALLLAAEMGGD
jgi:hypothetical protein